MRNVSYVEDDSEDIVQEAETVCMYLEVEKKGGRAEGWIDVS
jgi:hypothetical protein